MSTEMQTKVQASPVQSFTPVQTGLLQRQYTLCNTPGLVEYSKQDKEKSTLQRRSVDQAGTTTVPRFGHDFSRLSVHSTGPGMIQTKLKINKPGDPYEQEADRVADAVMRMSEPGVQRQPEEEPVQTKPMITLLVQRQTEEEEEEVGFLQTKELTGQSPEVTPTLSSRIQNLRGGGQPLPESVRAYFEPRFGYDFSRVSVHSTGPGMIQTKLKINEPGDPYEQEADWLAEQVMRMEEPEVQRQPDEEEGEEILQPKELPDRSNEVTPALSSSIQSLRGGGQPLSENDRAFFEPRFGRNFSHVRVHPVAKAVESAKAVNALAYTVERHIVFGAGQYASGTREGRHLLAHELMHVTQQDGKQEMMQRQQTQNLSHATGYVQFVIYFFNKNASFFRDEHVSIDQAIFERLINKWYLIAVETEKMIDKGDTAQKNALRTAYNAAIRVLINRAALVFGKNENDLYRENIGHIPMWAWQTPHHLDEEKPKKEISKVEKEATPCVPKFKSLKAEITSSVGVREVNGRCALILGTPGKANGTTFTSKVEAPAGCTGTLQYVQLVDFCRSFHLTSGEDIRRKTGGYWIDKHDPVDQQKVSSAGSQKFKSNDSPHQPVGKSIERVKVKDSYKMWLMWKPDQPGNANRVSLAMVTWNWSAEAKVKKPGEIDCSKRWTVTLQKTTGGIGKATKASHSATKTVTSKEPPIEKDKC